MPSRIGHHDPNEGIEQARSNPLAEKASRKFLNSAAWRAKLRPAFLRKHPLCFECGYPGNEVHHLIDRRDRPDLAYEWDNLQTLCKSCHSKITNERKEK